MQTQNEAKKMNCAKDQCEDVKEEIIKRKCLGNDPGKKDIMALSDGVTTLCYTRHQRNKDTNLYRRRKKTLKMRKKYNVHEFESQDLSTCSRKSCLSETFISYCRKRNEKRAILKSLYTHPHFRQSKFYVYTKEKSSEIKFFNEIERTFCKQVDLSTSKHDNKMKFRRCLLQNELMKENLKKDVTHKSDIMIAYGNGGKGMNNLKGTQSAPNVKIKKHLECYYKVFTQDEHYTSKTCPCCEGRSLGSFRFVKEGKEYKKHHLLRCTNVNCESRWWNRNVVGSYNILKRFLHERITPCNITEGR
jgi:hypothetical protein